MGRPRTGLDYALIARQLGQSIALPPTKTNDPNAKPTLPVINGPGDLDGGPTQKASPTGSSPAGVPNPAMIGKAMSQHFAKRMYILWYIVAAIAALFLLRQWLNRLRQWQVRRKLAHARKQPGHVPSAAGADVGAHAARALSAFISNLLFVQVIPLAVYDRTTLAEWLWVVAYIGTILGLTFNGSWYAGKFDWVNPMGMISFAQIPLVVGLAGRNSVLSYVTGVSYEKLNFLHRAAGRTVVLTATLHAFGHVGKGLAKVEQHQIVTGAVTFTALLLIFVSSFRFIRNAMYEVFLLVHIGSGLAFIVGAYFHYPRLRNWIWPALVLWGLDRACSLVRLVWVNQWWLLWRRNTPVPDAHTATAELLGADMCRLTLHRPAMRWQPGQHALLTLPSIAGLRYEQHPFTIANCPDEDNSGHVVFLVRAHNGVTRRLIDALPSYSTTLRAHIDGPYGIPKDMNHYDSVLLFAGGSGVTFALAHFLQILREARKGTSAVTNLHLVWNVRQIGHIAWIAPMLNDALALGIGGVRARIDVHVTASSSADEPGPKIEPQPPSRKSFAAARERHTSLTAPPPPRTSFRVPARLSLPLPPMPAPARFSILGGGRRGSVVAKSSPLAQDAELKSINDSTSSFSCTLAPSVAGSPPGGVESPRQSALRPAGPTSPSTTPASPTSPTTPASQTSHTTPTSPMSVTPPSPTGSADDLVKQHDDIVKEREAAKLAVRQKHYSAATTASYETARSYLTAKTKSFRKSRGARSAKHAELSTAASCSAPTAEEELPPILREKPRDDARRAAKRAGLSRAAQEVLTFHTGRSHADKILGAAVASAPANACGVGVAVCGPTELVLDVRRAVCSVNTARGIWVRGQASVDFYSETFGF